MPEKTTIARWVSIVGSPFVLIPLLVLGATEAHSSVAVAFRAAGVVALMFIPLGIFMRQRHLSGHWETIDASHPDDRPALFVAGFTAAAALSLYFLFITPLNDIVRAITVAAIMLAVCAAMNRWIKLSLHLSFAAFAGMVLIRLDPYCAMVLLLFLPILFWSRVALGRHTVMEAIGGVVLGTLMAGVHWSIS